MLQVHSVQCSYKLSKDHVFVSHTENDSVLQEVISCYHQGWPKKKSTLSVAAEPFWNIRNELNVDEGLVYFKNRLVIPNVLRRQILQQLHEGHQGIVKCKSLDKRTVFWPNISIDIEAYVNKCRICADNAPSQKKMPMIPHPVPYFPYEIVGTDILEVPPKVHLVVIDCYSKRLYVIIMPNKFTLSVIKVFEFLFSVHDIPRTVLANNTPFLAKKCMEFAQSWNFNVTTCSPHYHQTNGLAEKAVDS